MLELDDATRRALLAREGPPAGANAEVLASLRGRLGGAGGPGEGGGEPSAGAGGAGAQLAWAAKVVGVTTGLTAAGLLTLKLSAVAILAVMNVPEPARDQPALELIEAQAVAEGDAASEPDELIEPVERSIGPTANVPVPKAAATKAAALDPPPTGESSLADELALVRAAKQLRASDPKAALAELERHRERFPTGALAPEREVLRVELLCVLGRELAASQVRAQFVGSFADSPLRARMARSCDEPGTDPDSVGD